MRKFVLNKRGKSAYIVGKKKVEISLALFSYKEGEVHVIYSPALDLFGYGKTEKEAENSFEITIEEFIRYTVNKNTLFKELKRLGWIIKRSKEKLKMYPPALGTLLKNNKQFNEIFNEKPYMKYNETVEVPLHA
jgi:hypothetical protein